MRGSQAEYEVLLLQFPGGIVTLQEGLVTQGVGGEVEMVRNQKVGGHIGSSGCNRPQREHLFFYYANDCIGTASCSHEELEQFINLTYSFDPNLKFTWTIFDTSLSFLDLFVSISGDRLETDI
eukprot:g27230.t1